MGDQFKNILMEHHKNKINLRVEQSRQHRKPLDGADISTSSDDSEMYSCSSSLEDSGSSFSSVEDSDQERTEQCHFGEDNEGLNKNVAQRMMAVLMAGSIILLFVTFARPIRDLFFM